MSPGLATKPAQTTMALGRTGVHEMFPLAEIEGLSADNRRPLAAGETTWRRMLKRIVGIAFIGRGYLFNPCSDVRELPHMCDGRFYFVAELPKAIHVFAIDSRTARTSR